MPLVQRCRQDTMRVDDTGRRLWLLFWTTYLQLPSFRMQTTVVSVGAILVGWRCAESANRACDMYMQEWVGHVWSRATACRQLRPRAATPWPADTRVEDDAERLSEAKVSSGCEWAGVAHVDGGQRKVKFPEIWEISG